jgi:ribose 5-phosphate isomerase B
VPFKKKTKIKELFLASDHAGYKLKESIKTYLINKKRKVLDLGPSSDKSVDYTDYAHHLAKKIGKKNNHIGILICGSGIGMSMAANRHKKVRAALCYSIRSTKLSRLHNNANVMSIGSRFTKKNLALKCVDIFIKTKFIGGRHLRRVKKI